MGDAVAMTSKPDMFSSWMAPFGKTVQYINEAQVLEESLAHTEPGARGPAPNEEGRRLLEGSVWHRQVQAIIKDVE